MAVMYEEPAADAVAFFVDIKMFSMGMPLFVDSSVRRSPLVYHKKRLPRKGSLRGWGCQVRRPYLMISRLISKRTIMGMAKRHCDKMSVVGVMTAAATRIGE